jgi:hypothetical protein
MAGVDIIGLLVVLLPFYLVWNALNNAAKEKTLEEFLGHGKRIINIVLIILLVVGFPESFFMAAAVLVCGLLFSNGGTAGGWYQKTVTNWLTGMWNKVHPQGTVLK